MGSYEDIRKKLKVTPVLYPTINKDIPQSLRYQTAYDVSVVSIQEYHSQISAARGCWMLIGGVDRKLDLSTQAGCFTTGPRIKKVSHP